MALAFGKNIKGKFSNIKQLYFFVVGESEPKQVEGNAGMLLLILAVILIGGRAEQYFKAKTVD